MDWSLLGFRGLDQVFNVHPVFVHFPIAFFPASLLLYILAFESVMVLQNGDLGGRMVFVEGAAVKAIATRQEGDHGHGGSPQGKSDLPHDHHDHDHQH